MIIDMHAHVLNKKAYKDYQKESEGRVSKILVLHDYTQNFDKLLKFVKSKKDLFLAGCVDMNKNILRQLKLLEKLIKEKEIIAIKLYPGYQYFYPSDKKVHPIAKLCQKHNIPLIFHCGDVYDLGGKAILKYAHPKNIDELAVTFPKCKIILSHFGFPYFMDAANIVSKNKNVFTDISGTIDACGSKKEVNELVKQYKSDLIRAFTYFPDVKKKVMFGTDFHEEGVSLCLIKPYIKLVKDIFSKKEQDNVFYKLSNKLFFNK